MKIVRLSIEDEDADNPIGQRDLKVGALIGRSTKLHLDCAARMSHFCIKMVDRSGQRSDLHAGKTRCSRTNTCDTRQGMPRRVRAPRMRIAAAGFGAFRRGGKSLTWQRAPEIEPAMKLVFFAVAIESIQKIKRDPDGGFRHALPLAQGCQAILRFIRLEQPGEKRVHLGMFAGGLASMSVEEKGTVIVPIAGHDKMEDLTGDLLLPLSKARIAESLLDLRGGEK